MVDLHALIIQYEEEEKEKEILLNSHTRVGPLLANIKYLNMPPQAQFNLTGSTKKSESLMTTWGLLISLLERIKGSSIKKNA